MVNLYSITGKIRHYMELQDSMIDYETGEVSEGYEEVSSIVDYLKEELVENKGEEIIKYSKMLESEITAIKNEEKRLTDLRKRNEKKLENLKKDILTCLSLIGEDSIKSTIGNIKRNKSQSCIIDENSIPKDPRYTSVVPESFKYDKNAIKKLINSGEKIEGAMIQTNESVTIK